MHEDANVFGGTHRGNQRTLDNFLPTNHVFIDGWTKKGWATIDDDDEANIEEDASGNSSCCRVVVSGLDGCTPNKGVETAAAVLGLYIGVLLPPKKVDLGVGLLLLLLLLSIFWVFFVVCLDFNFNLKVHFIHFSFASPFSSNCATTAHPIIINHYCHLLE